MLNNLKLYLKVYRKFIETSAAEAMSFRTSFVLLLMIDTFFMASIFASVHILYDHVSIVGVWSKEQFLLFIAFMMVVEQFHMTFISENFWSFSYQIQHGEIDFLLTKPLSTMFSIFFRRFRLGSIPNVFISFGALGYYGHSAGLTLSDWMLLPFLILLAFALMVTIEILISCANFWIVEGYGINFLRMQFQDLSRWPDFIYRSYVRKIFILVIPILLIGNGPVRFLIDPSDTQLLYLMLGLWIVLMVVLDRVWRFALRKYESVSS